MRCEYIYRLLYNIYVYYVHQWKGEARRSAPSAPCLALAMKSLPVDYARHDKQARTHIFTVRDNERERKRMNTQCSAATQVRRAEREWEEQKKKRDVGSVSWTCSWELLCPKPCIHHTHAHPRTHARTNKITIAKRNGMNKISGTKRKKKNSLPRKEHRFLTLLENRWTSTSPYWEKVKKKKGGGGADEERIK